MSYQMLSKGKHLPGFPKNRDFEPMMITVRGLDQAPRIKVSKFSDSVSNLYRDAGKVGAQ